MTRRPDGWNSGQMGVRTGWLDRPDGWQGTWILLTCRLWIVESLFTAPLHLCDFVQTQNEAKILTKHNLKVEQPSFICIKFSKKNMITPSLLGKSYINTMWINELQREFIISTIRKLSLYIPCAFSELTVLILKIPYINCLHVWITSWAVIRYRWASWSGL